MLTQTEKDKARSAVRRAVDRGTLTRPPHCEECGSTPERAKDGRSTIHAHHHKGYEQPLDVRWLCPACHFAHDLRPSGEDNGRAKLTKQEVVEIRAKYRPDATWWNPTGGARTLAREFGVSDRTIKRIIKREIWIDAALHPMPEE